MRRPFDDMRSLAADLPAPEESARAACRQALGRLDAPGRLGRLAEIAEWAAATQGRSPPRIQRPIVALYAAAHAGARGDSPKQRLDMLARGGGAVSAAAREYGAGVEVFDLACERPVGDAALGATMAERECAATMAFGMEALAKTPDLLVLGELASGAERAAGALAFALFGGDPHDWTAPGDAAWTAAAAERARAEAGDPLELLRQLGGRETAALVGAILAAGSQRVPVLLDGYAAAAAAAVVQATRPSAIAHCRAGHVSNTPGHARLLDRLGLTAVLDLDLAAGEGLGAAAAIGPVRVACALAAADV